MKIGFTSTQRGLTQAQKDRLLLVFKCLWPTEFHHGDCIGGDVEAADLIRKLCPTCKICLHPASNPIKRAFSNAEVEFDPKPYIERNHDIVSSTDYLVAAPFQKLEVVRSGTWATIRFARKLKRRMVIVFPDGSVEEFNVGSLRVQAQEMT